MTIEGAGAKGLGPKLTGIKRDVGDGGAGRGKTPAGSRAERSDSVEISAQGRALAGEIEATGEAISPERMAELRERLDSGFYNKPEAAEALARRLLDGDVI